jgi:hypothetical protein
MAKQAKKRGVPARHSATVALIAFAACAGSQPAGGSSGTSAGRGTSSGGATGTTGSSAASQGSSAGTSGTTGTSGGNDAGTSAGGGTETSGGNSGGSSGGGAGLLPSPHGVYVPTFQQPIVGTGSVPDGGFQQLLGAPFVDGFFLSRGWSQVEASGPGAFKPAGTACKSILGDLGAIATAGKKATLAIGAGSQAPAWMCESTSAGGVGASCFTLTVVPPGKTTCDYVTYPAMWDATYQQYFASMVAELAACVASNATAQATLVDAKITGLNDHDEETILPYQDQGGIVACTGGQACQMDAGTGGWCAESNDLAAFDDAGYTAASGQQAFLAFAQATRTAFDGGLPIGSEISSHLLVPPGVPDAGLGSYALVLTEALVADAALYPITVQEQGLAAANGATGLGVVYAADAGVPIGFQMVAAVVGNIPASCEMAAGLPAGSGCTCPDQCLLYDAIENGVDHGARWLEIYEEDLVAFPDAGSYAHDLLTDGG